MATRLVVIATQRCASADGEADPLQALVCWLISEADVSLFSSLLGGTFSKNEFLGINIVDPGSRVLPTVLYPLPEKDAIRIGHLVALHAIDDERLSSPKKLLGIEKNTFDASGNFIKVYPNPSSESFIFELEPSSPSAVSIRIYDLSVSG